MFQGMLQMICASNYNAELQGGQSVATSFPLSLAFLSISGWVRTQQCEGSLHGTLKFKGQNAKRGASCASSANTARRVTQNLNLPHHA
jgi:hypothetical protein